MFRPLLTILLFVIAIASAAAAEPVFPRGLQVGLEPVGDLKPGDYPGFQDLDRKVTVAIAELPPPAYESLERTIFGKDPAGATKVARETFPFRDGLGYLHVASVVENGVAIQRWILLAAPITAGGRQNLVTVVNVNVPETARAIYPDAVIRHMLASVTIRQPPIEEQLGLIPFKLGDLAGFRVMQVQPEGVILTDGPTDDIGRQPYMIVSVGHATPDQMTDRERFARDVLSTSPLRDLTIQSGEEMRVGGRPGYEIRARAKDLVGNQISLVQWVRFTGNGFMRIVGTSRSERWDEMFNRFRAVRDGVDLR
jgi:hypothetical protein